MITLSQTSEVNKPLITPENCLIVTKSGIAGIDTEIASNMLLRRYNILHIVENNQTFIYNSGVYCTHGREVLERELYSTFEGFKNNHGKPVITKYIINETIARVCSLSSVSISDLESSDPILNLSNGILDLDTLELKEHSPEIRMLTQSPVAYDPDAKCPDFMEFLDQAIEPKYKDLISEVLGYALWPTYPAHKAFMLLGPKRTGKGTTVRVIEAVIGKGDCSHVSLQDLIGNRFSRARLFGMKLNTYGDLPALPINDAGIFKNLTGEDTIDAENKFEPIFSFQNRAKLLYSANELPMLKRDDDAYYSRWIIIPFENSVYGREDPTLMARLTMPDELSGILNFGLEGLARLRSNNWRFSYEDDAAAIYKRKSKPVIAFLEDCYEASDTDYVVKADLLSAYNTWAKSQGLPPAASKKAFGLTMQDQTAIPVVTSTPLVNGKQVEAWSGIRLKK